MLIPGGDIFDAQSSHTVTANNIQPNVKKLKVFQIKDEIETVEMDQESWDQNKDFIENELIRTRLKYKTEVCENYEKLDLVNLKYLSILRSIIGLSDVGAL